MGEASAPDSEIDRQYLHYQYDDAEKFRIRVETHERYSEQAGSFREWLLQQIAPAPGVRLLDVGCGPGTYHPELAKHGAAITACDQSPGMLREAVAQAESGRRFPLTAVIADAETLPFSNGTFGIVMANFMLYHVADQPRALAEMRRVLRRGGRAVFATNGADNCARIDAMHAEAARSLGYTPAVSDGLRFTLDDLPVVRSVFPSARVLVREDAFVFPDAASAVRYYGSYHVDAIEDRPSDGSHRPLLLERMRAAVQATIEREGVFRVPKTAGCFVAEDEA